MEDFAATGMVQLAEKPLYRKPNELKFKTPSGKIEILTGRLEGAGLASLRSRPQITLSLHPDLRVAFHCIQRDLP
jgi:hypothetical protein